MRSSRKKEAKGKKHSMDSVSTKPEMPKMIDLDEEMGNMHGMCKEVASQK